MAHGDYWDKPSMDMASYNATEDKEDSIAENEDGEAAICSKTITYLLDGEVGLLADLALIAQAAALARERNRTFIIDDTYWNRGKWMDYFQNSLDLQPGPEPGCLPPRTKGMHLVACPRIARHWVNSQFSPLEAMSKRLQVITAHTSRYHFGHAFAEHYEDAYGRNLNRLRPIYNAAHESLASAIQPNANLDALIRAARHEFRNSTRSDDSYLSVHIRRGDRKLRFSGPDVLYVPTSEYVSAIKDTQDRLPILHDEDTPIYFASDSLTAELEFANAYAGRFFSLRQSASSEIRQLASTDGYDQKEFNKLSDEERVRLTKGMVVDFALLSGAWTKQGDPAPRASVCTKSSNVCKMIAVGLGWDNAFGKVDETGETDEDRKGWVEIEEKGTIVPVWTAFELF
ncbi:hypothetical protein AGABI2DRAFT_197199 [Agaricus bisporus var. bisporus H97]|uniref:hypothetical protein n=1 Tax=Agaricus bisporus var. bisporus (strain H97 / ATCC MYA-4626 / FGSC 10389) TaxID=936046 RepID=UPI00029F50DD|nr:hypothetical protein AGABI2DRAFT_197199 [Agaricus bisporus var. bisporus H97]EKV51304.1 hypothetical protein AGABI2DRAFT_197199 [Agaricus bisporus var. bisporus H97]